MDSCNVDASNGQLLILLRHVAFLSIFIKLLAFEIMQLKSGRRVGALVMKVSLT